MPPVSGELSEPSETFPLVSGELSELSETFPLVSGELSELSETFPLAGGELSELSETFPLASGKVFNVLEPFPQAREGFRGFGFTLNREQSRKNLRGGALKRPGLRVETSKTPPRRGKKN